VACDPTVEHIGVSGAQRSRLGTPVQLRPVILLIDMFTLLTTVLAASGGPQPEGLMKCTITHESNTTTSETMKIHMESVTPTLPYKSSYCKFASNDPLTTWDDSMKPPHCSNCVRSIGDPEFSITCHCTCPAGPPGTPNCTFAFDGTVTFKPKALGATCACNGEPPTPPGPPTPPPPPPPPGPGPPCKAKLDVVVILDGSASIVSSDWQSALTFTNKLVNGFNISADQVELAVVQFSSSADTVIGLTDDAAAIHAAVTNLNQMRENTNTFQGFKQAKDILDTQGRPNTAGKVVILITDGIQNQGLPAKMETDKLKSANNATIFGIGVGGGVDKREIDKWVSTPTSSHYFPVSSFSSLEKVLQAILHAACPPHPPVA